MDAMIPSEGETEYLPEVLLKPPQPVECRHLDPLQEQNGCYHQCLPSAAEN
jgi:hypothetical protein